MTTPETTPIVPLTAEEAIETAEDCEVAAVRSEEAGRESGVENPSALDWVVWYRRHAASWRLYAEMRQREERMRAALGEAHDVLVLASLPSFSSGGALAEAVATIGNRHGFGALMSEASVQWRDLLTMKGLAGGEFVAGPCRATVEAALEQVESAMTKEPATPSTPNPIRPITPQEDR